MRQDRTSISKRKGPSAPSSARNPRKSGNIAAPPRLSCAKGATQEENDPVVKTDDGTNGNLSPSGTYLKGRWHFVVLEEMHPELAAQLDKMGEREVWIEVSHLSPESVSFCLLPSGTDLSRRCHSMRFDQMSPELAARLDQLGERDVRIEVCHLSPGCVAFRLLPFLSDRVGAGVATHSPSPNAEPSPDHLAANRRRDGQQALLRHVFEDFLHDPHEGTYMALVIGAWNLRISKEVQDLLEARKLTSR